MLFERIESPGLAHYSYLIGDGAEAVVIDPRRDVDVYVQKIIDAGMRLKAVLETHRNEDYVIGSLDLAARTGAKLWHADAQLDYGYGQPVEDGQTWQVERLKIEAIHTPGHTEGSMSYLLYDPHGDPWIVFTGDALFAGDVGRVDFLGMDRAPEMAGRLYDAIFERLLPLGDGVIVCPAHGSGSVCGSGIAERIWTTIGLERRLNAKLQFIDRDDFIANVVEEMEKAPYFSRMEQLNVQGPPLLGPLPSPPPLSLADFAAAMDDAVVLDTRIELGFSTAHVPGSLSIWLDNLPRFAGWFVPYDTPILLVNESADPTPAVRYLVRMGYDDIIGTLAGGMMAWHKAGRPSEHVQTVTVQELCGHLDSYDDVWLLDVRKEKELATQGQIPDAYNLPLAQLPERIDEVPVDRPVYIFCGSGMRAMTAASLLKQAGHRDPIVVLGGLSGWTSTTCPLEL
jgi:hydroxyacylglutathione hydrolase